MEKPVINTEMKGSVAVITVNGRIDSETSPALDVELTKAASGNSKLVIDLKGVDYMSSAGLRAITKASQAAEEKGGAVKLASVPEEINSVMYTVGLNQKISSYATVDEAVASF
ncbi:Anti-sigma-B factor antagonist [Anaerolineae bacterium]|nr:Anti-sigma-B factor antagonist [Anaerolineae bacterium]